MNQEILYSIIYAFAFGLIISTSEILYRTGRVKAEITRKLAHSAACLLSLSFPLVYNSYEPVLIMGMGFYLLLIVARYKQLLQSIHNVTRKTYGSFLLPLAISGAFYVSVFLDSSLYFILPIVILGVSDSLAGITGEVFGKGLQKIAIHRISFEKTYLGTTIFFTTAFLLTLIIIPFHDGGFTIKTLSTAIAIGLGASAIEVLSPKGLDNITIPLTTILILLLV